MIPFLEKFLASGLKVPQFCELNKKVGQPRCMPGSELHDLYREVTPTFQKGFEVPYTSEEIMAIGATSGHQV
jgi:hypothetical protein